MTTTVTRPVDVRDARDIAQVMLSDLPDRWRHTIAVARRAEELAAVLDLADPNDLVAAAWLHDVGYADEVLDTGFHPLDGARFLGRHLWPLRVRSLVAHHSGAIYVAAVRGLDGELRRYHAEKSLVSDALTYADQTCGPHGERMTVPERMADMLRRHGPESPSVRAHHLRGPHLLATAARVERRLARILAA
jgi:putative nucleotidyltransferase with HDIG domain